MLKDIDERHKKDIRDRLQYVHDRIPNHKIMKTAIELDPVNFLGISLSRASLIKDKDDRKQFLDWVFLFKDRVERMTFPDGQIRYIYFTYSVIIFDGVDAVTCINDDGTITLSKGELSLSEHSQDDIFPMETWKVVAKANPYEMIDIIIDQYNNVDNRYMSRFHDGIHYKRHDGPWTSK